MLFLFRRCSLSPASTGGRGRVAEARGARAGGRRQCSGSGRRRPAQAAWVLVAEKIDSGENPPCPGAGALRWLRGAAPRLP